jgi:hypothetical protein
MDEYAEDSEAPMTFKEFRTLAGSSQREPSGRNMLQMLLLLSPAV